MLNQIHKIQTKYLWVLKEVLETANADTTYNRVSVKTGPFGQTKHWDEQRQFCVLLILEYKQHAYAISQRVLSEYVKILFKYACQIGYKLIK